MNNGEKHYGHVRGTIPSPFIGGGAAWRERCRNPTGVAGCIGTLRVDGMLSGLSWRLFDKVRLFRAAENGTHGTHGTRGRLCGWGRVVHFSAINCGWIRGVS